MRQSLGASTSRISNSRYSVRLHGVSPVRSTFFPHLHYNFSCDSLFRAVFVVYFYLFYVPQFTRVLRLAFDLFSVGKFVLVLLVFCSQLDFSLDARSLGIVLFNFAVFSAQFLVSLSCSFYICNLVFFVEFVCLLVSSNEITYRRSRED